MIPRFDCQFGLRDSWIALFGGNGSSPDLARLLPGLEQEKLKAILTWRGREALYLILKSLGLPPESRIAVPLFTCSVVAKTVRAAGMVPVFIDQNASSCGMDLSDLEKKAGDLAAVVMVHTFGYPEDIDSVKEIMLGRPIIGDCAHAVGSTYKGRAVGTVVDASLFTFGLRKPLGIGGGGCVITPRTEVAEKIDQQMQASRRENKVESARHVLLAFAYATAFQGVFYSLATYASGRALGDDGLRKAIDPSPNALISPILHMRRSDANLIEGRIQEWHNSRQRVADFWTAVRTSTSPCWHLPEDPPWGTWNYFMLPFRVESADECTEIIAQFRKRGVGAARIYANCVLEATVAGYTGDCPTADRLSQTVFMVPGFPRMSDSNQQRVIKSVREISSSRC